MLPIRLNCLSVLLLDCVRFWNSVRFLECPVNVRLLGTRPRMFALPCSITGFIYLYVYECYLVSFDFGRKTDLYLLNFLKILVRSVALEILGLFGRLLISAHLCSFLLMCRFLPLRLHLTSWIHLWSSDCLIPLLTPPLRRAPLQILYISLYWRLTFFYNILLPVFEYFTVGFAESWWLSMGRSPLACPSFVYGGPF